MKTTLAKGERQENAHERLFIEFRPNDLVDFIHDFESVFDCLPVACAVAFRFALYKRQKNYLVASLTRDDFQHHRCAVHLVVCARHAAKQRTLEAIEQRLACHGANKAAPFDHFAVLKQVAPSQIAVRDDIGVFLDAEPHLRKMDLFSAIVELRKIAHSIPRAEIPAGKNGLDHSIDASHGRVEEVSRHISYIAQGWSGLIRLQRMKESYSEKQFSSACFTE